MKRETLVSQAHIGLSCSTNLLGLQETPCTQAIGDRYTNNGFADVHTVFYDERQIVSKVPGAAHGQATAMDPDANW